MSDQPAKQIDTVPNGQKLLLEDSPSAIRRYGVAVLCVTGAVLLRWLLDPVLGPYLPLATIFGFVGIAVWYGGWGPALFTAVVSYLVVHWLIIEPQYTFHFAAKELWGLTLFAFSISVLIWVGESMRRAQRQARLNAAAVRESETRFRILADCAPVLIWMNGSMGAEFVNRAYLEFIGTSRETDVMKFDWAQYIHPDDRHGYVSAYLKTFERRALFDAQFRFRRHDGEYRWMRSIGTPRLSLNGELLGYVGATFDITDNKETESQLEHRVEERTQELVHSQDRLRMMATELSLAEQRERKRLAGELHDYLAQLLVLCRLNLGGIRRASLPENVEDMVKETEEVLNKALNFSRTLIAELSPPVLQEHGLPAGLKWLGEQMQRRGLNVVVEVAEPAAFVLAENRAVLLYQSVRELLINVLKHANSKAVAVHLRTEEGRLRIDVHDDGRGFDLAVVSPADSIITAMSAKYGLYSIRERMKALGGSLELVSAPGKGSRATLILPIDVQAMVSDRGSGVADVARGSHYASGLPTANGEIVPTPHESLEERIRVLLVDDHTMVRQALRSVLDHYANIEVVGEACDGEEAVAAAIALNPTIVLMDINMPKMNGINATRAIKARVPDTIVIGLSVQAEGVNEEVMIQAGAAMLLTKEAAVDELFQAIEQVMRGMQQMSRHGS